MGAYLVIAPDLLGHGRSAKPRGDYSLGAYASGIRDLLLALGDEVHVLLRAATLPLSEFVLPLLASRRRLDAGQWVSRTLGRVGLRAGPDVAEMAHGLEAQELIPGSRMEVLPGAGHFPMLDDPAGFAGILREFVDDTDPAWLKADDLRQRVLQGR